MQTDELPRVRLSPAAYVTVKLASSLTGLSEKAIRRKIEEGKWIEGCEYRRAGGGVFISMKGYEQWVEGTPAARRTQARREALIEKPSKLPHAP